MADKEFERQIFHLVLGIGVILSLLYFGRGFMIAAVFTTIIIGTILINSRLIGIHIGFVKWFETRFERKNVMFPGWGSACYAAGVLIPLVTLTDVNQITAVILILALGDCMSGIIGRMGKNKLPYNKKKTIEGTLAFIIASLPAYYFVGIAAIPLAVLAGLAESVDIQMDDNILVPLVCSVFFLVL
ncbi:MAG: hypothetical protein ABII39_02200 [Candidatus Micrarchaeota archaeon]